MLDMPSRCLASNRADGLGIPAQEMVAATSSSKCWNRLARGSGAECAVVFPVSVRSLTTRPAKAGLGERRAPSRTACAMCHYSMKIVDRAGSAVLRRLEASMAHHDEHTTRSHHHTAGRLGEMT